MTLAGKLPRLRPDTFAVRYDLLFPAYAQLPPRWGYALAAQQAAWFRRKRVDEATLIRQQMQRVFPDASAATVETWLQDYYRMVEQEALDTWYLQHQPLHEVVTLRNFAVVEAARRAGQRVLLTGGHFGRFWLAGAAMRERGFTTGTITRDGGAENTHGLHPAEYQFRLFKLQRLQQVLGGPFLVEGEDLRPLYRALDEHLITLIFDVPYVNPHKGSVTVPFFNASIDLPAGIYRVAKKMQAVVVPFFMRELGNGRVVAEFSAALEPSAHAESDFMGELASQLALRISEHPGQWWLWAALPLLQHR